MDVTLTDVDGVSDATAKKLREAGYESVESVAGSSTNDLSEVKGFGPERASEVITNASDLLSESMMTGTAVTDVATMTVSYDVPADVALFVIDGLLDEAVSLHADNVIDERNRAFRLLDTVIESYAAEDISHEPGSTWTLSFEATSDDLDIFKRGMSGAEHTYKSIPGIPKAWGMLGQLRDEINEDRNDFIGQ